MPFLTSKRKTFKKKSTPFFQTNSSNHLSQHRNLPMLLPTIKQIDLVRSKINQYDIQNNALTKDEICALVIKYNITIQEYMQLNDMRILWLMDTDIESMNEEIMEQIHIIREKQKK